MNLFPATARRPFPAPRGPHLSDSQPPEHIRWEVRIEQGRLLSPARASRTGVQARMERFSTASRHAPVQGALFAPWLLGTSGRLYSAPHPVPVAGALLCSGEWCVSDGHLLVLCGAAGHLPARREALVRACERLAESLPLANVLFATTIPGPDLRPRRAWYRLEDWWQRPGCEPLQVRAPGEADPFLGDIRLACASNADAKQLLDRLRLPVQRSARR